MVFAVAVTKQCNWFYILMFYCKAAPTRASNLCKLVCTNCLTTAADGTSMLRKPSEFRLLKLRCEFFNSFREHALIELINLFITYFFSTFRYFSLYLFSNLTLCSFFLFLLLSRLNSVAQ